ncbi:YdcF family protein [Pseudoflavitalea rhizosphaerae]|uniref:YdcF family protein n=1 Tax=Pseudoflavitalea rhizosphaerae TaxID=1884793 RepID=UPI000F8DEB4D|nr:YdcF family protein [Pseudoflavitalea rhizosphaerae]
MFLIVRLLKRCISLVLLWMIVHCTWATVVGLQDFRTQADVAIVLGNEAYSDGSLSPWLKGRVDAALRLYRNQQVKMIMVSGGIGESGFPEGDAMRNYLVEQGVPAKDIFTDNKGDNSYFTAKNFIALNQQEHFRSAVVVSSWFHVLRCRYIVKKLGFENVATDHSRAYFWKDIFGLVREFPAYYKYMLVY